MTRRGPTVTWRANGAQVKWWKGKGGFIDYSQSRSHEMVAWPPAAGARLGRGRLEAGWLRHILFQQALETSGAVQPRAFRLDDHAPVHGPLCPRGIPTWPDAESGVRHLDPRDGSAVEPSRRLCAAGRRASHLGGRQPAHLEIQGPGPRGGHHATSWAAPGSAIASSAATSPATMVAAIRMTLARRQRRSCRHGNRKATIQDGRRHGVRHRRRARTKLRPTSTSAGRNSRPSAASSSTAATANAGCGNARRPELEIVRKFSWLHTELVPYMYSHVVTCHNGGPPLMRPLARRKIPLPVRRRFPGRADSRRHAARTVSLPPGVALPLRRPRSLPRPAEVTRCLSARRISGLCPRRRHRAAQGSAALHRIRGLETRRSSRPGSSTRRARTSSPSGIPRRIRSRRQPR